jgi:nondiscriminating glutamyl-tRNA synthetase
VSKAPAIFDTGKLKWMNGQYIKKVPLERVVELAIPHLVKAGRIRTPLDEEQKAWVTRLVGLYQEQMEYAAEIVELSELFFQDEISYSEQARQVLAEEQVPAVLKAFLEQVQQSSSFEPDDIKKMFKQVQKETGYKGKKLFMPVRVAVTGLEHGPDLRGSLSLIGRDRVIKRLHQVIDNVL